MAWEYVNAQLYVPRFPSAQAVSGALIVRHSRLPAPTRFLPCAPRRRYAIVSKRSIGTAPSTGLPAKQSTNA